MRRFRGSLASTSVFVALAAACGGADVAPAQEQPLAVPEPADQSRPDVDPEAEHDEPVGSASLEEAVTSRAADDDLCASEPEALGAPPLFELDITVDGVGLVAITCETFAYQSSYVFAAWDGAELWPVEVEQWREGEVVVDRFVLGLPGASADGAVTNLERGNGIGTCGTLATWGFDGVGLHLTRVQAKACDGDDGEYVEPDQWPVVFGEANGQGAGEDVAGEDPESVLRLFGDVWGAQDVQAMADLASPEAVETAREAGPGEVFLDFTESCWPDESGNGFCEYGFVGEGWGPDEFAHLYSVSYVQSEQGTVHITQLSFAGTTG